MFVAHGGYQENVYAYLPRANTRESELQLSGNNTQM